MRYFRELNEVTYLSLAKYRSEIKKVVVKFQLELAESETIFNMLDSIFDPKVAITVVDNAKMGHRYLGKIKVVEPDGKYKIIGFSIGRVDKYNGKDDIELEKDAKLKALSRIRALYPMYFSDKNNQNI